MISKEAKIVIGIVSGFILFSIGLTSFTIVNAGERAVILRLGAVNRVVSDGLNLKFPIIERVKKFETRTVKYEVPAIAYSKDIQTVEAAVVLNYHLEPGSIGTIYKELGEEYRDRVIVPSVQEVVKAIAAQFTAQELVEERPKVKDGIKIALTERLLPYHIIVGDVSITNFDFSDQYEKAVEQKQVAQQDALTARNKLEQVKFEAEQRVATAKAEAEAIRIQAQAITQQGGAEYVRLKQTEKWDGKLPVNMYGSAPVPFINVNQ